jgi:hypothetical protein
MAVYKRGKIWWYKFNWNGEPIRETTKQTNKRIAEQMEAAHKVSLAKGEVGIRDRKPTQTLREFAEGDFLPFVRATFVAKPKTLKYYEYGVKSLLAFERIADSRLDTIRAKLSADSLRSGRGPDLRYRASIENCRLCGGCFGWPKNGARCKRRFPLCGCCRARSTGSEF